jgi:hypothetical protein
MATETWTGTDGAAWSGWNTAGGTIQSNKGRLTPSGGYARGWWNSQATHTDFDLTVTFKATGGIVTVGSAAAATDWWAPDVGHYGRFEIESSTTMGYISMRRNGTELTFAYAGTTADTTNGWTTRVTRTGAALKLKIWTAGAAEPGTWLIETTDGSPYTISTDQAWLGTSAATTDFDDLTLTTGAATASLIIPRRPGRGLILR